MGTRPLDSRLRGPSVVARSSFITGTEDLTHRLDGGTGGNRSVRSGEVDVACQVDMDGLTVCKVGLALSRMEDSSWAPGENTHGKWRLFK